MGNRFGKEWGRLSQGDKRTRAIGTNTFNILFPEQVLLIPNDRVVTYTNIVVDYRPQKYDPNCVRITAGGNLIIYPGESTTRKADITTSEILFHSIFDVVMSAVIVVNYPGYIMRLTPAVILARFGSSFCGL